MKKIKYFLPFIVFFACKDNIKQGDKNVSFVVAYNVNVPEGGANNWDIFTIDPDGTHRKNIIKNKDIAWTYYAYEDKLFFISDRDTCKRCYFLYRTNAQGQKPKKVSELQLEDSWMSSRNKGTEMIVSARIGNKVRKQLFVIDLEKGSYKQITNDEAASHTDPCFSPDGKQIVFSYKANKKDTLSHEELFIMNVDGTDKRQLTHFPENDPSLREYSYKAGAARWHPTENFISYISKQNGKVSIFGVSPDGKKQWRISKGLLAEGWHDWSPDGEWLVYNSSDSAENQFHIMLLNNKTGVLKKLTDDHFRSQQAPVFVKK